MKLILTVSFLALQSVAFAAQDCDFGSTKSGLWPDHRRDLIEQEAECKANLKKGIKPQKAQLALDADEKTVLAHFKKECDRDSDSSSNYPDAKIDLYNEEQECLRQGLLEHKKLKSMSLAKSPSKERCDFQEGVAYHCPEGVYKFQGSHDLKQINDELRKNKEIAETPKSKGSKSSSKATQQ